MMHRPCSSAGNHLPDLRVFPRFQFFEVNFNASLRKAMFDLPHGGQTALGENVHFDQTNGFNGVHVKVGGRVAFVGNERGCQFLHRLPGED